MGMEMNEQWIEISEIVNKKKAHCCLQTNRDVIVGQKGKSQIARRPREKLANDKLTQKTGKDNTTQ